MSNQPGIRRRLIEWWLAEASGNIFLEAVIQEKIQSSSFIFVKFLLNPSSDPEVIYSIQQNRFDLNLIYKLTRTYCYSVHRERMKIVSSLAQESALPQCTILGDIGPCIRHSLFFAPVEGRWSPSAPI